MSIRIWNGDVKISVKIFYILSLLLVSLAFTGIRLYTERQSKVPPLCVTIPPNRDSTLRNAGRRHMGCWKDPIVYNTPETCPECFRPNAEMLSRHMTPVPSNPYIHPRPPRGFFKPKPEKQHDFIKRVLLEPTSICVNICPYIVALQTSVTDEVDERNTIRSTWASVSKTKVWPHANLNADMEVIFVLAHQSSMSTLGASKVDAVARNITKEEWQRVKAEADRYGDVLYMDMIDSYYNLTLKVISALKWARDHCPRTKFFLKVDADTFVNVPLMVDLLIYNQAHLEFSVVGYIYQHGPVFRAGRWGVSKKLWPMHMFPVYASGCAYVISATALFTMMTAAPYMPMNAIEDAYVTGMLARLIQVPIFMNQDLFTHFKDFYWQRCQMVIDTKLVGTFAGGYRALDIWSAVVEKNETCFEEDYSGEFEKYYKLIVPDERAVFKIF